MVIHQEFSGKVTCRECLAAWTPFTSLSSSLKMEFMWKMIPIPITNSMDTATLSLNQNTITLSFLLSQLVGVSLPSSLRTAHPWSTRRTTGRSMTRVGMVPTPHSAVGVLLGSLIFFLR